MRYAKCSPALAVGLLLPAILVLAFCGGKKGKPLALAYRQLDEIPPARWAALANERVFFGHKSVGQNIIEGLQDVMKARPGVSLDIRETTAPGDFVKPLFAHADLGKNKAPLTKIEGFCEILEKGLGDRLDVAFFKLCFVDIDHTTDIEDLFVRYSETVRRLSAEFPKLKILTFTVPLLSKPLGFKERVKKLLGRLPWEEEDNIKRNLYNDKLRQAFKDSLFDLAAYEAAGAAGERAVFVRDGRTYDLLLKAYTSDGGHLNRVGRQIVAIELLKRLAAL
jgi:hypothetical protein